MPQSIHRNEAIAQAYTLQYTDQGERVIIVFPMQYHLIGKASDHRVVIFTSCKGISCDYGTAESSLKFSGNFYVKQ